MARRPRPHRGAHGVGGPLDRRGRHQGLLRQAPRDAGRAAHRRDDQRGARVEPQRAHPARRHPREGAHRLRRRLRRQARRREGRPRRHRRAGRAHRRRRVGGDRHRAGREPDDPRDRPGRRRRRGRRRAGAARPGPLRARGAGLVLGRDGGRGRARPARRDGQRVELVQGLGVRARRDLRPRAPGAGAALGMFTDHDYRNFTRVAAPDAPAFKEGAVFVVRPAGGFVDGGGEGTVLRIRAAGAVVEGVRIRGSGEDLGGPDACVQGAARLSAGGRRLLRHAVRAARPPFLRASARRRARPGRGRAGHGRPLRGGGVGGAGVLPRHAPAARPRRRDPDRAGAARAR